MAARDFFRGLGIFDPAGASGVPWDQRWFGGGGGNQGGNQISGGNAPPGPQFAPPGQGGPQWDAAIASGMPPNWQGGPGAWNPGMSHGQNVAAQGGMNVGGDAAAGQDPSSTMQDPGFGEEAWKQHGDFFFQPGEANQYWNEVQGRFTTPRQTSNYAEEAYHDFNNAGITAGLDPYYDRARRRTSEDINSELAARGMHGSSAGMDILGEALGGLSAEQANREGDFRLRAHGLQGQLGRGADISSAAGAANELDWLTGGAGLAGAVDAGDLSRRSAGMNAALGAQGAEEGRLLAGLDRQTQMDQFNTMMNLQQFSHGCRARHRASGTGRRSP